MNKYLTLKRSQICIALHATERELLALDVSGKLRIKPGSARDCTLRANRSLLLAALRNKDDELYAKFEKAGFSQLSS